MATLRDIRSRIKSVKNTQQITKAMKMVSAAKLRRAQEMAVAGRAYYQEVTNLTRALAGLAGSQAHPLFRAREEQKVDLILFASDKGLCGSFNANVLRAARNFIAERPADSVTLIAVGKKARDFAHRSATPLAGEFVDISRAIGMPLAKEIAALALARLTEGKADATYLVYGHFVSVLTQRPTLTRLFPIPAAAAEELPAVEYLYEPARQALVDQIVPMYTDTMAFQALVESTASEMGARMSAMDTATKNAGELIARLTLFYNRARQAAITKELIEVVSGADALEG